jgi:hypothetical protein
MKIPTTDLFLTSKFLTSIFLTSKVSKNLIHKRITKIEDQNKTKTTGLEQHGFKKCKSTETVGLVVNSQN